MARTARALAVWANGVRVGLWRLPSRGAMEFDYDDSLAQPRMKRGRCRCRCR